MTNKAAARKVKPGELKRQAAVHKSDATQALQAVADVTKLVQSLAEQSQAQALAQSQQIQQIADQVRALQDVPVTDTAIAEHDPARRMVNDVLGLNDVDGLELPEKPEVILPDGLARAARELNRRIDARNNPAAIRQSIQTDDRDIGQFEPRIMNPSGPAKESLPPLMSKDDDIVLETRRYSPEKIEMELFMHEMVCVRLNDSTDDTQIPIPQSGNGGPQQAFVRGRIQWVKRKFLEPLLRAKRVTYSQQLVTLDNGDQTYKNIPHTTLMYPFEVVEDTPKGKAWVQRILREPR